MTPEQFCYWLQGYFEISGNGSVDEIETQIIKDHLATIFEKVTPDRRDPIEEYDEKMRELAKRIQLPTERIPLIDPDLICSDGTGRNPLLDEVKVTCHSDDNKKKAKTYWLPNEARLVPVVEGYGYPYRWTPKEGKHEDACHCCWRDEYETASIQHLDEDNNLSSSTINYEEWVRAHKVHNSYVLINKIEADAYSSLNMPLTC